MAIDIAAMDAAQKLEFAQAVGSVKLASGDVSAPVAQIILMLPTGYSKFFLSLWGFQSGDLDNLAMVFSSNGGVTFHSGASDYHNQISYSRGATASANGFDDTDIYLNPTMNDGRTGHENQGAQSETWLTPGSATIYATAKTSGLCIANAVLTDFSCSGQLLAELATQNAIAIQMYDPSTETITAGTYNLYGYA